MCPRLLNLACPYWVSSSLSLQLTSLLRRFEYSVASVITVIMSNASGNVQPRVKPKNYRKRGFRKGHAGYVTRMHSRAMQESESESLATWMPRLTEVEFEVGSSKFPMPKANVARQSY